MKDCEIPLDIAFLAQDGKILDIQNMELSKEADYAKPLYVSKDPRAVYALEMASNWFKDNKVNTGDELCLSF